MRTGAWKSDAEKRLREFFNDETWEFLPEAVIAFNAALALWTQTATLFDEPVATHAMGQPLDDVAKAALSLDLLWVQQQETLELVRAMNDAFVLRTWDAAKRRVRYTPVSPDFIDAEPSPDDPSQPNLVRHDQMRTVGDACVWCRDTWDFRNPKAPTFAIMAYGRTDDGQDTWTDVTTTVMPEVAALPGRWPMWSTPPQKPIDAPPEWMPPPEHNYGEAIWPWTAYHSRVGCGLFDPLRGREVADGTLDAAVLWTFLFAGARDASFVQRWLMDAELAAKNAAGKAYVPANPMMVMMLRSTITDRPGAAGQWAPAIDVEKFSQMIGGFVATLALFAGLSGSDVSVASSGLSRVSGVAIEVSRDGRRKIERKMIPPMRLGDQHNLAGAAMLSNAYAGTQLPTDPESFGVVYGATPRTLAEIQAEVQEVTTLTDAGLMHPRDALRRFEPHLTEAQAEDKVIEIAAFRRTLNGTPAPEPPAPETDDEEGQADAA
jgi:hypothetical protein